MRKRLIWFWSWLCWLLAMHLPWQWNYTRLGMWLLPWAGLYGHTDGGWPEFKQRDF